MLMCPMLDRGGAAHPLVSFKAGFGVSEHVQHEDSNMFKTLGKGDFG